MTKVSRRLATDKTLPLDEFNSVGSHPAKTVSLDARKACRDTADIQGVKTQVWGLLFVKKRRLLFDFVGFDTLEIERLDHFFLVGAIESAWRDVYI